MLDLDHGNVYLFLALIYAEEYEGGTEIVCEPVGVL
jgi:hypothetical protein